MSYDKNICTFSGKITGVKQINTRTGTPMTSLKLQSWKEQIRVVCFKELADQALNTLHDGDRAEIAGRLQSSSWDYEGVKRYGFQIIADEIRADTGSQGQEVKKSKMGNPPNKPNPHELNEHDYSGGPF